MSSMNSICKFCIVTLDVQIKCWLSAIFQVPPGVQFEVCFKTAREVCFVQLNNYLTVNGLRERFQSAYKAPHNTETAPLMIKNDILLSLDRGNNVYLMFLDLLAAFHMVNHSLLLDFASGELVWYHGDCSAVVSFLSVSPIAVCRN